MAANLHRGHIKVDHNLDFRHINTSCKHIGCDDYADFAGAELFDHLIALLMAHIAENDGRFQILASHHLMQSVSVRLSIDENDSLGHLTDIKDGFDELWLFALFTPVFELLDVVERELLLLEVDLVRLTSELRHGFFHIFCVGG